MQTPPSSLNKSVTGVTNSVGGKQKEDNWSTELKVQVHNLAEKSQFGLKEPAGQDVKACDCKLAIRLDGVAFDKQRERPR